MRRRKFVSPCICLALLLIAPQVQAKPAAAGLLKSAAEADRALRNDERRLRFRHNIMNVVKKWATAKAAATGAQQKTAAKGEAEAWALLAHWSGRRDDQQQADALLEALDAKPVAATPAPKTDKTRWLTDVSLAKHAGGYRFDLAADGTVELERHTMPGRAPGTTRVYFDLTPIVASKDALGPLAVADADLRNARVSQFDKDTARIVFDVDDARADQLTVDGQAIVFEEPSTVAEREDDDEDPRSALVRLEVALKALTKNDPKDELRAKADLAETKEFLAGIVDDVRSAYPDIAEPKVATTAPTPKTQLKRSTREAATPRAPSSILAVRRIVIDPGHGGKDHGASGPGKVREKDVNLAISKRLKEVLEQRLGVQVLLTRSTDKFISLRKRSQIANSSGADLFISVHANANRNKRVHGIETYHLNVTSNRYAKRLAGRENALAQGHGDVPEPDDDDSDHEDLEELIPDNDVGRDLRLVLADLAMRSATVESRRLAGYVQSSLVGTLRRDYDEVKDLGVKHALFYVLLGARMPAILVETGFVSSPMESKRLATDKYQTGVANSIASGVERFIRERQRLAANLTEGGMASLSKAHAAP